MPCNLKNRWSFVREKTRLFFNKEMLIFEDPGLTFEAGWGRGSHGRVSLLEFYSMT